MEAGFKIAFGLLILSVLLVLIKTAFNLKRAGRVVLTQIRQELPVLIYIRTILALPVYVILFWWLIAGQQTPFSKDWPILLRWSGFVVSLFGVALWGASVNELGGNYSGGVRLYDDHELVTTGPYSVVRHPIYTAIIIVVVGLLLLTSNLFIGGVGLTLVSLVTLLRVGPEEKLLEERFGESYLTYRRSTGAFFPRLRPSKNINH